MITNKKLNDETRERLKEFREKNNLSQFDFAQALGIEQPSYSQYETGKNANLSTQKQRILEREFGLNIEWLWTGEGEMKIEPMKVEERMSVYGNSKLIDIIESQQKTIYSQQQTIDYLIGKNRGAGAV